MTANLKILLPDQSHTFGDVIAAASVFDTPISIAERAPRLTGIPLPAVTAYCASLSPLKVWLYRSRSGNFHAPVGPALREVARAS